MTNKAHSIPLPTIKRLPIYLGVLNKLKRAGRINVSATDIAKELSLIPIQVRKDLALTGIIGKPKIGYEIDQLRGFINKFIGWENDTDAFIIGAGALGSALMGYDGFEQQGLRIIAAFDINKKLHGKEIHGKKIFPLEKLKDLAKRMKVSMAVLTVPADNAQSVVDIIVKTEIRGIWNFSPVSLNVPPGIIVQNENLASGLAVLSTKLRKGNK